MRFLRVFITIIAFGVSILGSTFLSSAQAQSMDGEAVQNRLLRLENEMRTLNQYVYRGKIPPSSSSDSDTSNAGSFEVRLTQLEDQISKLTGRVEEIQFAQKKLQDSQKKMADDVEFRFNELDKKIATSQVSAATPPPVSAPSALAYANPTQLTTAPATPLKESPFPTTSSTVPEPAATAASSDPQKAYDQAQLLLRQADYPGAETALKDFIARNPTHELTGNAQYWLAETYYVRAMYPEAALAFGEGFEKYPKSQKAPDNLLKLGLSLEKLNKRQDACRTFGLIGKTFPNSPETLRAKAEQERGKLKCS